MKEQLFGKIKTILVDDEVACTESLDIELKMYCPQVKVIATCNNSLEAHNIIKDLKPDLVFMDIEMPKLNGFELLSSFESLDFEVIFVTAYDQFALKAFKFSAVDYLLKPIVYEELIQAVEKVERRLKEKSPYNNLDEVLSNMRFFYSQIPNIAISTSEGLEFVAVKDILYCEADKNYCYIHMLDGKKILLSKTLKDVEGALELHNFLRIHQSYLVNIAYIKKYVRGQGGYIILTNGKDLPVSRAKKEEFLTRILK